MEPYLSVVPSRPPRACQSSFLGPNHAFMELRRRIIFAALLLLVVTSLSVLGYRLLGGPDVGFLQALYMAVITLAGVGYGEFVDTGHNVILRVFNIFVVL